MSRSDVIFNKVHYFFVFYSQESNNLAFASFFLLCALATMRCTCARVDCVRVMIIASTRQGMRGDVNLFPPVLSSIHPQFAPSCSSIQTGQ